ncbi:MAG: arginase family protein, partial [Pseudomonadota bacterium]
MTDPFFHPVSGFDLPRFAGVPTFMRLPHVDLEHPRLTEVGMGLIGVPWDAGTTNRPGPRHGPRQLRDYSTMVRTFHPVSGVNPYATVNCADLGDVGPNPADLQDSMTRITAFYDRVKAAGVTPMTVGGDHLVSLPVLRSLGRDAPL